MIKSVINVQAPPEHVFKVLTDYARYQEWIPGCEKCTVTSQNGNVSDTEIIVNGMKRIEMALRFDAHPPTALSFRMTRGKDMKSYAGT